MRFKISFVVLVMLGVVVAPLLAQNPTGTLSGRVTDGAQPLPGVAVTAHSANLQGRRIAVTSINGDYIFRFLPPGDYAVKFELAGFQTVDTNLKISAAQTSRLDATMPQAKVREELVVTGTYDTISTTSQSDATTTYDLMNKLPVAASINNYAALAPGVSTTGPSGSLIIAGAMSFENAYMVNGVNIQDNVRLTPHPLYIEDAVQETTTATAGISAEYGRFAGGVINMITKSGGNDLHGSFRLSLASDKWHERAPLEVGALDDTINQTYQATAGGRIIRDRLWFFLAGRSRSTQQTNQTYVTNVPYTYNNDEVRYEGKLTFSATPGHRLIGSYISTQEDSTNDYYRESRIMDKRSLFNPSYPSSLVALNYNGVVSNNLFIEVQYSRKKFAKENAGATQFDRINGTLCIDTGRGGLTYRWWSPTQSMKAGPEQKNNEEYLAKASYFLSTTRFGTHDVVAGVDHFTDVREFNNYQSGSDFRVIGRGTIVRGDTIYPQWAPGTSVYIQYNPIFEQSKGTDFVTQSAFINDKWRLNKNLSLNVGLRYDKNDGRDSLGKLVANDSNWSPRLGATYDPKANGDLLITASFGKYVTALANTVGNGTSSGGRSAQFTWYYKGPTINKDANAGTLLGTAEALQIVFDWFDSIGGITNTNYRRTPTIPGVNTVVHGQLLSPNAQDLTIGFAKRLGAGGVLRLDLVHRAFKDFYMTRVDMQTGQVATAYGKQDLTWYTNDRGGIERTYNGAQMQFSYRLASNLDLGGNWTISKTYGNVIGETAADGPTAFGGFEYPEYRDDRWSTAKKGELSLSQRHKARLWAVWDLFTRGHNRLSMSLLQSFYSGTPYGASGNIDTKPYVNNPGYVTPPASVTYWFTSRDKWWTDNITRTDLSFYYAFVIPTLGTDLEFFLQPVVTNLFNERAVENVNTAVSTGYDVSYLAKFNPFSTRPTECPQGQTTACSGNWQKGADFGKPTGPADYQNPRTFTVSVGVRF